VDSALRRLATFESLAEVLVEEARDLGKDLPGLRGIVVEIVLGVRHALVDLKLGFDTGAAKLAVREYGQAQEEVARAAGQNSRWKAGEVAVDRRELRVFQVMSGGVELRSVD
jgi:hypothetical protein